MCRVASRRAPKTTVACAACGASVTMRTARLRTTDYYLCGPCGRVPAYKHPAVPEGIRIVELNAAGSFTGFTLGPATPDAAASLARARRLRDAIAPPEDSPLVSPVAELLLSVMRSIPGNKVATVVTGAQKATFDIAADGTIGHAPGHASMLGALLGPGARSRGEPGRAAGPAAPR